MKFLEFLMKFIENSNDIPQPAINLERSAIYPDLHFTGDIEIILYGEKNLKCRKNCKIYEKKLKKELIEFFPKRAKIEQYFGRKLFSRIGANEMNQICRTKNEILHILNRDYF